MHNRSSIIGGLILILVGVLFLLLQLFPGLGAWLDISQHWPLLLIGLGGIFLVGAVTGLPPLAIPGTIITGIGSILYYQNLSGNWDSWVYIWALIPGFVGLGLILMARLDPNAHDASKAGGILLLISAILFVVFGAAFSGFGLIGQFWPVLLIVFGLWLLVKNRRSGKNKSSPAVDQNQTDKSTKV